MELTVKYQETTFWSFIDHIRINSQIYDEKKKYEIMIYVGSRYSYFNLLIQEINKKEMKYRSEVFSSKLFRDTFEEMSNVKWPKPFLFPISSYKIYHGMPEPFWQFYLEQDLYKIHEDKVFGI